MHLMTGEEVRIYMQTEILGNGCQFVEKALYIMFYVFSIASHCHFTFNDVELVILHIHHVNFVVVLVVIGPYHLLSVYLHRLPYAVLRQLPFTNNAPIDVLLKPSTSPISLFFSIGQLLGIAHILEQ